MITSKNNIHWKLFSNKGNSNKKLTNHVLNLSNVGKKPMEASEKTSLWNCDPLYVLDGWYKKKVLLLSSLELFSLVKQENFYFIAQSYGSELTILGEKFFPTHWQAIHCLLPPRLKQF